MTANRHIQTGPGSVPQFMRLCYLDWLGSVLLGSDQLVLTPLLDSRFSQSSILLHSLTQGFSLRVQFYDVGYHSWPSVSRLAFEYMQVPYIFWKLTNSRGCHFRSLCISDIPNIDEGINRACCNKVLVARTPIHIAYGSCVTFQRRKLRTSALGTTPNISDLTVLQNVKFVKITCYQ